MVFWYAFVHRAILWNVNCYYGVYEIEDNNLESIIQAFDYCARQWMETSPFSMDCMWEKLSTHFFSFAKEDEVKLAAFLSIPTDGGWTKFNEYTMIVVANNWQYSNFLPQPPNDYHQSHSKWVTCFNDPFHSMSHLPFKKLHIIS